MLFKALVYALLGLGLFMVAPVTAHADPPVDCNQYKEPAKAACLVGTGHPTDAAANAAGDAAGAGGSHFMVEITKELANGAGAWVGQLEKLLWSNATTPDFTSAKSEPFWDVVGRVLGIATVLAALLSLASLGHAVATNSLRGLGRWLVALASVSPAYPLIVFLLIGSLLLADAFTPYVAVGDPHNITQGFTKTLTIFNQLPPQQQSQEVGAWFLLCLLALATALMLAAELLVREGLLYVLVALLPLSLLGGLLPNGGAIVRKSLKWIAGLIIAKPLIAIVLAVGLALAGGVDQGIGTQGLARCLAGVVILMIAVAAPLGLGAFLGWSGHELGASYGGTATGAVAEGAASVGQITRASERIAQETGSGEPRTTHKLAPSFLGGDGDLGGGAQTGSKGGSGASGDGKQNGQRAGQAAAVAGAAGGPAAAGAIKGAAIAADVPQSVGTKAGATAGGTEPSSGPGSSGPAGAGSSPGGSAPTEEGAPSVRDELAKGPIGDQRNGHKRDQPF